jgi:hypothetical protein
MYYAIKFEFQIAARRRAAGDQIRLPCSPADTRTPQRSNFSSAFTPRTLSKFGYGSPFTLYQSGVTSHRILIKTPRLEFPATLTKQRPRLTSNRDKIGVFSSGSPAPTRNRRELPPLEFLIANLELEFFLNIAKSIKYKFLIANKRGFSRPPQRVAFLCAGIRLCMPESKFENRSTILAGRLKMRNGDFRRSPVKVKSLLCYGDSHFQLCKMVTNTTSVTLGEN